MGYVLQTRASDTLASQMAAGASSCTLTTGSFGTLSGKQIITIDYNVPSKAADFLCTIAGTAVSSMTRLNGPDVVHDASAAVAMCFVDEHYSQVLDAVEVGWVSAVGQTWTYATATTFTITGDYTAILNKGDKIKLTQTTAKYFYVTAVSYSAPNTTVTVTGGSDYSLANAAITSPYYSKIASPNGFPTSFNWSPSFTGFSANPSGGIYNFVINGDTCTASWWMPNAGTSNATGFTITAPVTATTIANMIWFNRMGYNEDSGAVSTTVYDYFRINSAGTTIDHYKNNSSTGYTNSGNKRSGGSITYRI